MGTVADVRSGTRPRLAYPRQPLPRGVADVLGIVPPVGRLLAVECKSATGRPAPDQAWFLDAVRTAGGVALVVRDVAELVLTLDRLQAVGAEPSGA